MKKIINGALLASLALTLTACGGSKAANVVKETVTPSATGTETPAPQVTERPIRIGDTFKWDPTSEGVQAHFEIKIKKKDVRNSITPSEFSPTKQAQGQYVIVSLTAKNAGNKPLPVSGLHSVLYDSQGREYKPDESLAMQMAPQDDGLFEEINPGSTATRYLVWDVPKDAQAQKLRFQARDGSAQVDIQL